MFWSKKRAVPAFENLEISLDKFELRKRSRIVVIDDEEAPIVEDLKREGYNIEQWLNIRSFKDLEERDFDLIILDIVGVGREFSRDEGFGVLKHLRESGSSSKIIAYSGQTFNPSSNEFFSQADAIIGKDAGLFDWMKKIDELLREKYSIKNYREFFVKYCEMLAISDVNRRSLEKLMLNAIEAGDRQASPLQKKLGEIVSNRDIQKSMFAAAIKLIGLGIEALPKHGG